MTVRVNKSAFNIREKLSELERPIGVKGNELMRAETAQEAGALLGVGRKNIIINGNHSVNQRGVLPVTGVSANAYQATDRWKHYKTTITANASLSSVTLPNGIITNALKATASSSGSGVFQWYQMIEDKNREVTKGQWVTLSGWIRSNNPNARLFLWGGSSRQGYASHSGNGQWEYLSFSCIVSTNISALEVYAAIGDAVNLSSVQINSGDYVEFALMQLEMGKVATEFEHRSYGEELALCMRYYQNSYHLSAGKYPGNTDSDNGVITTSWSDGNAPFPMFRVPMRAQPTITLRGRGSATTGQVQNQDVLRSASVQQVSNQGVGYIAVTSGSGGGYNAYTFECSAEL